MPAPFTDYQPIAGHDNAFEFATPDGKTRTLIGPAALQMKQSIDSARQIGAQLPGPVAPPQLPKLTGAAAAFNPQSTGPTDYAGQIMATPPARTPPSDDTAPAAMSRDAVPQQGAPQLPPGQQAPGAGNITMPRYASVKGGVLDTTTGIVRSAGTPGASKAQIEAEKKAQAEQLATMSKRADEQQQRTIEKAQILAENADAQQMALEEQRSKAETAAFQEELRNREIADRVVAERADVEKQMADWRSSKVDPDRFFKGEKGGTNKMLASIGIIFGALSQFGQGLMGNAGAGNPGVALLSRKIDDDIREQEREISVKKESKDNALAQLGRSLGDMQQAKLALKAMQTDVAVAKMGELANATKSPLIRNQLGDSIAVLQAQKEAALAEFARLGELKLRAMRGSGPSVRAATLDELKAVSGIRSTDAGTEKTGVEASAAANKLLRGETGEEAKPVPTERTTKINNSVQALVAATQLEQRLRQESPSDWSEPRGSKTPTWLPGTSAGTDYAQLDNDTLNAAMLKQKSLDLGSTEDDFQRAKQAMIGNGSVNARIKGAQGAAADAARTAAAELATMSPADQAKVLNAMPAEVAARIRNATKPEVKRER